MYVNPDGNLYIYLEEDDEEEPELATFKLFETGEAVSGAYIGTVGDGRAVKHLYWVNVYEGVKYDTARYVRVTDDVSEVRTSGGSDDRTGASGQGEDVQRYLSE